MGAIRRFTFGNNSADYNFDATSSNWGTIVSASSFKTLLESRSGETTNTITNFSLVSGRLRCNITNVLQLNLYELNITNVNFVSVSGLQYLDFGGNQIVTFNPTIALPTSLQTLFLYNNSIVTFNPTIALPTGLQTLSLNGNQIITFNPNIALPTGLIGLYLERTQIVTFNPTISLPTSLSFLFLISSQMTTVGYSNSEPWANAMTVIPGRGTIRLNLNVNSASGTNLKTILEAKGWTVITD